MDKSNAKALDKENVEPDTDLSGVLVSASKETMSATSNVGPVRSSSVDGVGKEQQNPKNSAIG